jgi:hypothetical protein
LYFFNKLIKYYLKKTVPDEGVFKVWYGTMLLHDVNLVNITFSTGVLSAAECNAKGFLQEQQYSNGSKVYLLQVPFSDDVVVCKAAEDFERF